MERFGFKTKIHPPTNRTKKTESVYRVFPVYGYRLATQPAKATLPIGFGQASLVEKLAVNAFKATQPNQSHLGLRGWVNLLLRKAADTSALPRLEYMELIAPNIYRGSAPGKDIKAFYQNLNQTHGVHHIIDLSSTSTAKLLTRQAHANDAGISYHQIPLNPTQMPTMQECRELLKIVKLALKEGNKVYIHCLNGTERTGQMVALIEHCLLNKPLEQVILNAQKHHKNTSLYPHVMAFIKRVLPVLNENKQTLFEASAPLIHHIGPVTKPVLTWA